MDGKWPLLTCRWQTANFTRYPYPIFEQLPFAGRIGLFALSAAVMALSTGTLRWLYGRVNGYGTQSKAQSRPGAIYQNGIL
jgi:hypothetical protein